MILVSAFDPLLALLRVDHLAHILGHKVALKKNTFTAQDLLIRVPTIKQFKLFQDFAKTLREFSMISFDFRSTNSLLIVGERRSHRGQRHLKFTFLRAWLVFRPQPRSAVLMTSVSA